jgi:hypothetical protein
VMEGRGSHARFQTTMVDSPFTTPELRRPLMHRASYKSQRQLIYQLNTPLNLSDPVQFDPPSTLRPHSVVWDLFPNMN